MVNLVAWINEKLAQSQTHWALGLKKSFATLGLISHQADCQRMSRCAIFDDFVDTILVENETCLASCLLESHQNAHL